jgi:hypothetical protein
MGTSYSVVANLRQPDEIAIIPPRPEKIYTLGEDSVDLIKTASQEIEKAQK